MIPIDIRWDLNFILSFSTYIYTLNMHVLLYKKGYTNCIV